MRGSSISRFGISLAVAAAVAAGCSSRTLVAVGPIPDAVPPGLLDDLIGHWRFDDGAGSVTAKDDSTRGNHGTLLDLNPTTAWVPGLALGAIDIANRGWVGVTPSASIDAITDRLTVAAWVYLDGPITPVPPDPLAWATALSREKGSSNDQHYHLSLNADAHPTLFVITATEGVTIVAPAAVARATWVHLAGTYDGQEARLYVDGALAIRGAVTGSFSLDTTPVIIGGNGNDATGIPTELFPGRLDEITLYRRALADDEVVQLAAGVLFPGGAPRDGGTRD